MTKEQLIKFAETLEDGEELFVATWTRQDVKDQTGYGLTNEEWRRFMYWYNKYCDFEQDFDDAMYYAKQGE